MTDALLVEFAVQRFVKKQGRFSPDPQGSRTFAFTIGAAAGEPRLLIGSRASCDVTVEDALVAGQHCAIAFAGETFWLEDLETSSGTYVSGLELTEKSPLSGEGQIVIGTSRLPFKVEKIDEVKDGMKTRTWRLTLGVKVQGFFFKSNLAELDPDPARRDRFDSVRWAESETSYGRLAGLLVFNLIALGLALLLVPATALGTTRARLLDLGPLHSSHAGLFDGSSPHARVLADQGRIDGCATCHTPVRGVDRTKCEDCHGPGGPLDNVVNSELRHPFEKADWTALPQQCSSCHRDHRGDADDGLRPSPEWMRRSCATNACHPARGEADIKRARAAPTPRTLDGLRLVSGFTTFSHKRHVDKQVACESCHRARAAGETTADLGAFAGRDFHPVLYATCKECHVDGKAPASIDAAGLAASAAPLPPAEFKFTVAWHPGADKDDAADRDGWGRKCTACHATVGRKELKTVETAPADLTFDVRKRSHAAVRAEFEKAHAGKNRDCTRCHANPTTWESAATLPGCAFDHGEHVTALAPADSAIAAAECRACHVEQVEATALATGVYQGPPADRVDCRPCHVAADGQQSLRPALIEPIRPSSPPATRNAFPHQPHVNAQASKDPRLLRDCFACHRLAAGAGGAPASADTLADARTCAPCHVDRKTNVTHDAIGGGDCDACHKAGDGVWSHGVAAAGSRLRDTGYDHFSPGHVTDARGIGGQPARCLTCHKDVATSESIASIVVPDEGDAGCRGCHVREQRRFHWR